MSKWTWERLETEVSVYGERSVYSQLDCDAVARRLGLPSLPPSYCEYVKRFGYGEWEEDLTIYVSCNPDLVGSVERFIADGKSIAEVWVDDEDVKNPEQFARLLWFGNWTSGFSLSWDPETRQPSGEMSLYLVAAPEVLEFCGYNLLEFLGDYWIDGKINEVYQFEDDEPWVCRPVFSTKEPIKPPY